MKKRDLKSLSLNKKSISDLNPLKINGGNLSGPDGPSWQRCSEVMSCLTYTQNNNTCVSCWSVQLCFSKQICVSEQICPPPQ